MFKAANKGVTDTRLDHAFFVLGGVAAAWLAFLLVGESFQLGWGAGVVLRGVLAFLAYLLLPRLHRILTTIYVPGYFIGRARTSDGLLGDPVNVALLGAEPQIHAIMESAGWTKADDVTFVSSRRIISSTIFRRSYSEAPVSPLYLFDRQQDFAYQQEVDNNPGKRHHVRFWRCPKAGSYRVDTKWIGLPPEPTTAALASPCSPCRSRTRLSRTPTWSGTTSFQPFRRRNQLSQSKSSRTSPPDTTHATAAGGIQSLLTATCRSSTHAASWFPRISRPAAPIAGTGGPPPHLDGGGCFGGGQGGGGFGSGDHVVHLRR